MRWLAIADDVRRVPIPRRLALGLLAALATLLTLASAMRGNAADGDLPTAGSSGLRYANPVLDRDFPDPSVLRVGDRYWAMSTSSWGATGFPIMSSQDLVHWTPVGQVFQRIPGWISDSLWAPELVPGPNGFLLYYSARRRAGPLCVAVASAPTPAGPWTDHGPLVCQPDGSIDPTRAIDEHGRPYLLWKEDGNSAARPSLIWAKRLRRDGLGLIGPRRVLLRNSERWEGQVVEAPEVIARDGWFYLFYSGNNCCQPACKYALGVARSRSLLAGWKRDPDGPILRPNQHWRCPGHATLVDDGRGHTLLLYHAYRADDSAYSQRRMLLDPVTWTADDWPVVADGHGPSDGGTLP
jgi:xylan 1,4-beta-xylosidase